MIRDERAKDPLITVLGLEHALEKHFNRGFSHQYEDRRQSGSRSDRCRATNRLHTDGLMARLKTPGIFTVLEFPPLREGDGTDIERVMYVEG